MAHFRFRAAALMGVGLAWLGVADLAVAAPVGGPVPLLGVGLPLAGGVIAVLLIRRAFRRKL